MESQDVTKREMVLTTTMDGFPWGFGIAYRVKPIGLLHNGRQHASVVSHKYGYEDARAFWSSARRDDEQWPLPREEEQRSRRPKCRFVTVFVRHHTRMEWSIN